MRNPFMFSLGRVLFRKRLELDSRRTRYPWWVLFWLPIMPTTKPGRERKN